MKGANRGLQLQAVVLKSFDTGGKGGSIYTQVGEYRVTIECKTSDKAGEKTPSLPFLLLNSEAEGERRERRGR